jgi:hypothetical protein
VVAPRGRERVQQADTESVARQTPQTRHFFFLHSSAEKKLTREFLLQFLLWKNGTLLTLLNAIWNELFRSLTGKTRKSAKLPCFNA